MRTGRQTAAGPATGEAGETTPWRDPAALAVILLATLTVMAAATISPALPGLLHLSAGQPHAALLVQWLVPAPSLAIVLAAPLMGATVDRLGRRPHVLAGLVLFTLAGTAGLVLEDLRALLVSRLVLGLGVAMVMTAQTALIGDLFGGARRMAVMGLAVSARNFGGFVFISLAGVMAAVSPRLPFAIYALPLAYLPLVWTALPEPARHAPGPLSPAAAGGGGWLVPVLGAAALQTAVTAVFFVMPTQLPFFLAPRFAEEATLAGLGLGALMLAGGLAALAYGRLAVRLGSPMLHAFGFGLMAAGFALLRGVAGWRGLMLATALIGGGYALLTPGFVTAALRHAPAARRGAAGGIMTTSVFLGQVLTPLVALPMIARGGHAGLYAALALALACAAAAGVVVGLLRRPAPDSA